MNVDNSSLASKKSASQRGPKTNEQLPETKETGKTPKRFVKVEDGDQRDETAMSPDHEPV